MENLYKAKEVLNISIKIKICITSSECENMGQQKDCFAGRGSIHLSHFEDNVILPIKDEDMPTLKIFIKAFYVTE